MPASSSGRLPEIRTHSAFSSAMRFSFAVSGFPGERLGLGRDVSHRGNGVRVALLLESGARRLEALLRLGIALRNVLRRVLVDGVQARSRRR